MPAVWKQGATATHVWYIEEDYQMTKVRLINRAPGSDVWEYTTDIFTHKLTVPSDIVCLGLEAMQAWVLSIWRLS